MSVKKIDRLFAVAAVLLAFGCSLPQVFVAEFVAGDPCTVATGASTMCATGGVDPCSLQRIICSGPTANATACQENGGNPACQDDENCLQDSKHALRQMDCEASGGTDGLVVPGG